MLNNTITTYLYQLTFIVLILLGGLIGKTAHASICTDYIRINSDERNGATALLEYDYNSSVKVQSADWTSDNKKLVMVVNKYSVDHPSWIVSSAVCLFNKSKGSLEALSEASSSDGSYSHNYYTEAKFLPTDNDKVVYVHVWWEKYYADGSSPDSTSRTVVTKYMPQLNLVSVKDNGVNEVLKELDKSALAQESEISSLAFSVDGTKLVYYRNGDVAQMSFQYNDDGTYSTNENYSVIYSKAEKGKTLKNFTLTADKIYGTWVRADGSGLRDIVEIANHDTISIVSSYKNLQIIAIPSDDQILFSGTDSSGKDTIFIHKENKITSLGQDTDTIKYGRKGGVFFPKQNYLAYRRCTSVSGSCSDASNSELAIFDLNSNKEYSIWDAGADEINNFSTWSKGATVSFITKGSINRIYYYSNIDESFFCDSAIKTQTLNTLDSLVETKDKRILTANQSSDDKLLFDLTRYESPVASAICLYNPSTQSVSAVYKSMDSNLRYSKPMFFKSGSSQFIYVQQQTDNNGTTNTSRDDTTSYTLKWHGGSEDLGTYDSISSLSFSPDGKYLSFVGNTDIIRVEFTSVGPVITKFVPDSTRGQSFFYATTAVDKNGIVYATSNINSTNNMIVTKFSLVNNAPTQSDFLSDASASDDDYKHLVGLSEDGTKLFFIGIRDMRTTSYLEKNHLYMVTIGTTPTTTEIGAAADGYSRFSAKLIPGHDMIAYLRYNMSDYIDSENIGTHDEGEVSSYDLIVANFSGATITEPTSPLWSGAAGSVDSLSLMSVTSMSVTTNVNITLKTTDSEETYNISYATYAATDSDNDGVWDDDDNCIITDTSSTNYGKGDQTDTDGDGIGDLCDTTVQGGDTDGDGKYDFEDNCLTISNPKQENTYDDTPSDTTFTADKDGDACDNTDGDLKSDGTPRYDNEDNCPTVKNADQKNTYDPTDDGVADEGDACDDSDGDGYYDGADDDKTRVADNCLFVVNDDQKNTKDGTTTEDDTTDIYGDACDGDHDGYWTVENTTEQPTLATIAETAWGTEKEDACPLDTTYHVAPCYDTVNDNDADNDGYEDGADNCPDAYNPTQSNIDGDANGDACDNDSDNDGVTDEVDNCDIVVNADQANTDSDSLGDACDNCDTVANDDQEDIYPQDGIGDACNDNDADNDGIADAVDNCPTVSNQDQLDQYGTSAGDACEDSDTDSVMDDVDACPTDNSNTCNAPEDDPYGRTEEKSGLGCSLGTTAQAGNASTMLLVAAMMLPIYWRGRKSV